MPQVTQLGITYLPGETLWSVERPVFEVSPNHLWFPTGKKQQSGPTDMLEWQVIHENQVPAHEMQESAVSQLTMDDVVKYGGLITVVSWLAGGLGKLLSNKLAMAGLAAGGYWLYKQNQAKVDAFVDSVKSEVDQVSSSIDGYVTPNDLV